MPPTHHVVLWAAFLVVVVGALTLDLGLASRREGRMPVRTAAVWSLVWMSLAAGFCAAIAIRRGSHDAALFAQGYIVEQALSVDNMFVFIVIFNYFKVPEEHQPRVLKYGIIGVIVFRLPLIIAGTAVIERAHWLLYVMAVFLLYAVYKLVSHDDEDDLEPEKNPVLGFARRHFPFVDRYEGRHFFLRDGARRVGTALLVVLIVIESTDIVFALDSIPAIFGITQDFFIVLTSNIFAVLGLRALFFVLSGIMGLFRYLKLGVAAILLFIAAKMLTERWTKEYITNWVSLAVIAGILLVAIGASVLLKGPPPADPPPGAPSEGAAPVESPAKASDRS